MLTVVGILCGCLMVAICWWCVFDVGYMVVGILCGCLMFGIGGGGCLMVGIDGGGYFVWVFDGGFLLVVCV